MSPIPWQLKTPVDAVIFDCDATLSQIEGIDVLAKANAVDREVQLLTEEAMNKTGITSAIYKKRLDLVKPTAKQLAELGDIYYAHLSPDVDRVIDILQNLHKSIFVVSAGIQSAVESFVKQLGIPLSHVFGVEIYFDEAGCYRDYDRESPMTYQRGKREVIEKLLPLHPHMVHVGDGMNDIEAAALVDRFVGYGGAYYRDHIASLCDFYIKSRSFAPLLPLCLTQQERNQLSKMGKSLYQKGLDQINRGNVLIRI